MKKSIITCLVGVLFLTAGEYDIPTLGGGTVSHMEIVGDFDYDGYDDMFVQDYHTSTYEYNQGIYSFAKKMYLIELSSTSTTILAANLGGDLGVEIIHNGKIYTYSEGTVAQSAK